MVASNILPGPALSKKINLVCLALAIITVLVLPFTKGIWYDETVSVLCSKGISHDTPGTFAGVNTVSSAALEQLNNTKHVFSATVLDNSNSFLYNICLHFFTELFGNSLTIYALFSKLCAIAALIALFALTDLIAEDTLLASAAVLLVVWDLGFLAISHEIRAYSMAIFLVVLSAFCWYKFVFRNGRAIHLFLMAGFLAAAIMTHFLTVYIAIVLALLLVWYKKAGLFTARNIVAILLPAVFLGLFFYYAKSGFTIMGIQGQHIQQEYARHFNLKTAILRSLKLTAVNFKAVYPAFRSFKTIIVISFLLVPVLYVAALRVARDTMERKLLHTLFLLGISSSVFLLFLSVRSHHYTSLYFRYYSFGLPFNSLFVAWALYVFIKSDKVDTMMKYGLPIVIVGPVLALFILGVRNEASESRFNHPAIADEILRKGAGRLDVPEWGDALLVQSFLPNGYKIDYFRSPDTSDFIIHAANAEERIPVMRQKAGGAK